MKLILESLNYNKKNKLFNSNSIKMITRTLIGKWSIFPSTRLFSVITSLKSSKVKYYSSFNPFCWMGIESNQNTTKCFKSIFYDLDVISKSDSGQRSSLVPKTRKALSDLA